MANPWEEIKLDDYENHMSLDSVKQLQTMNMIMKSQFSDYPVDSAIVFGIAGGNGLEHVERKKYRAVYGVDINVQFVSNCAVRHSVRFTKKCFCTINNLRLNCSGSANGFKVITIIFRNL